MYKVSRLFLAARNCACVLIVDPALLSATQVCLCHPMIAYTWHVVTLTEL